MKNNAVRLFSSSENLFQAAAKDFLERSAQAIKQKGWCNVVLSGGNTPKSFYTTLVNYSLNNGNRDCHSERSEESLFSWNKIRFFFGDERYVSSEDTQSNFHTAQEFLFSKVSVPAENIYRVPTELPTAVLSAKQYEQTLKNLFKLQEAQFPPFDITYLGMGDNGHTASLMPFTDIVNDYIQNPDLPGLVKSLWVEALKMFRITLTPPAINHSAYIAFLVEGENKAPALKAVLQDAVLYGKGNPLQYPALLIKNATWFVDQAAASLLEKN